MWCVRVSDFPYKPRRLLEPNLSGVTGVKGNLRYLGSLRFTLQAKGVTLPLDTFSLGASEISGRQARRDLGALLAGLGRHQEAGAD